MKKGIIVEHKKRYSIVMDRQGMFHKVRLFKGEDIGVEVHFESKSFNWGDFLQLLRGSRFKIASMVVLCLFLFTPIYFWMSKEDVYAVVSIDINPSINITIDQNFDIIKMEAINEDAAKIINQLNWQNQSFLAISEEIIELSQNTYDLSRDSPVLMAISYMNEDLDSENSIMQKLNQFYDDFNYQIAIYEVAASVRNEAKEEKVSMNQVAAKELEEKTAIVSSSVKEEQEDTLPELDDVEQELIHNFYQDHLVEEESSDPVPVEEQNNAVEEESVLTPLPSQANDRAKENMIKNDEKKQSKKAEKAIKKKKNDETKLEKQVNDKQKPKQHIPNHANDKATSNEKNGNKFKDKHERKEKDKNDRKKRDHPANKKKKKDHPTNKQKNQTRNKEDRSNF